MNTNKLFSILAAGVIPLLAASHTFAFGRGGFGGGFRAGGGGVRVGGAAGHFGGGGGGYSRAGATVVGPGRSSYSRGSAGGSYYGPRGGSVQYGGAGASRTGYYGRTVGRGAGGVRVTTPGGQSYSKAGTAAGVSGYRGTAGRRSSVGVTSGPRGTGVSRAGGAYVATPRSSFSTKYRGGVAIGPTGAAAGARRVTAASGPAGSAVRRTGAGVAAGPYGAVAGARTGTVAAGRYGTRYVSRGAITTRGTAVRRSFYRRPAQLPAYTPGWYRRYPGAWFAAGWTAGRVWQAATWGSLSAYCGYPAAPIYYDYGSSVVYQGDTVYIDGQNAGTTEEYAQQATQIADTGREAKTSEKESWESLGVFALVKGDETTSQDIFQLAIDKKGIIRGTYYNALTDTTKNIYGSVDPKTQRAAWTVGDKKEPVFEAGIANLTKSETTIMVHYGGDRSEQYTFVRIEQPKDDGKAQPQK